MALEQTWRWFGPRDPVTLAEIRQTGATGIVTALHHIPVGRVWPVGQIQERKRLIEHAGLKWSVAESIPVHEDIKKRTGKYGHWIDQYRQSIRNLAACGIDTVCYNFMPLLDWSRTDLRVRYGDTSITTKFEARAFAAFDLFILKRPGAEGEYSEDQIRNARRHYEKLTSAQRERLVETVLLGLPGSLEAYSLKELRSALRRYGEIGDRELRANLYHFIGEIIPAAEESGVLM
ncbi:MAG TPA: mannonate dehydratase, partial [Bacteroidota bacterium]|nr:mannonate dehydratase [Bacteroidota bacterium]